MTTIEPPSPAGFADALRALFAEPGLHAALRRTADLAVAAIPACDDAALSLVERRGRLSTPVAAGHLARRVDGLQTRLGEGPSIDAVWADDHLALPDLADPAVTARWPRFTAEAARLPVGGMLAFRLFTAEETVGALTLYAGAPGAFTPRDLELGVVFSAQAASALAAHRRIANLNRALDTRETIGQAQGILMERHHLTADQAWEHLRTTSQNLNIRLAELAASIALTGEEPDGADRP
jgi:GAF domain-containing protein